MKVGSTYPNMAEFRVAISQHAIKREFEFKVEKSALYRFRAYCLRRDKDNCPWRLHASTSDDGTVVVKVNPDEDHKCSSSRRKKNPKHATKFWICAKLKDWLIDDATLGAKDKFRAAYAQLIPAMTDKRHWPQSNHGFFMHPPLLKATTGRPKTERYKGCTEKKRKSGKHKCPIYQDLGHHWPNCKRANPDDIAAMMAERGPPKKKAKKAKTAHSSIVPLDNEAPAASMSFPPRHWPQSNHGFFMHPPLLKATTGRPKTERYKGCTEKKRKSGKHKCPIYQDLGHHWPNCKRANPDDIAAMMAERGPPKKKAKKAKTAHSSIVPLDNEAPAASMSFPPSQNLESTTSKSEATSKKTKKNANSNSRGSKRSKRSGSNQLHPLPIELPETTVDIVDAPVAKANATKTKKSHNKKDKKGS